MGLGVCQNLLSKQYFNQCYLQCSQQRKVLTFSRTGEKRSLPPPSHSDPDENQLAPPDEDSYITAVTMRPDQEQNRGNITVVDEKTGYRYFLRGSKRSKAQQQGKGPTRYFLRGSKRSKMPVAKACGQTGHQLLDLACLLAEAKPLSGVSIS